MTGGESPFRGDHVLQKLAAPTKIESCVTRSNISKNQTCTPFLRKMALKYWTIVSFLKRVQYAFLKTFDHGNNLKWNHETLAPQIKVKSNKKFRH